MYSNREIRVAVMSAAIAFLIAYFVWGSTPAKDKQHQCGTCGS